MQQIPPQFSGGGSCPWLFVNISFKVKLAHCYLLSSPFSGASHSKFDWNCLFCELVIFCREDLSHCFSRAPLDKTLHVENFAGVGDETWMTKKAPSVKKGFRDKNICKKGFGGRNICQASSMRWEIAANARDWKESGDPEKEKIYWVKYFHSWGFGEQQNWDKKKVKLCFLQQIFGPGKSFSEIKVKLLLQKIFSQILVSGKSRSKIKEKLL